MHRTHTGSALVLIMLLCPARAHAGVLTADLAQRAAALAPGQRVPVIVRLAARVDPLDFHAGRAEAPSLVAALRATADATQPAVLDFLATRGVTDGVRRLWIDNSLALAADATLLEALAARADVASIEYDEPVVFDDADGGPLAGAGVATAEWGLVDVRVPELWSATGLDGSGVVVGSMDTGFDPAHPALAGKWRGGANSWIDIIAGQPSPYDDHGHGTHTIGTMVGGDGPGPFVNDIGVAPAARFISAKVLDSNNSFSGASIVIAGAQSMLDPDGDPATNDFPDIINNSWGFFSLTYTGFYNSAAAWRAAGIIPVFSIGNGGPGASTVGAPGSYDNCLGIAAVDASDVIASFSSRGPGPAATFFPADRRKPDLAAPGAGVTSSIPGGGYEAWFGTSMAAPHVAGTIALMKQANHALTFDLARTSLFATAVDRGAAGYDYDYGYGRLDAYAAVMRAALAAPGRAPLARGQLEVSPNPARGAVRLAYALPGSAVGTLEVFDLAGRRVWSAATAGPLGARDWDGHTGDGSPAAAGLYLARLASPAGALRQRFVLLP